MEAKIVEFLKSRKTKVASTSRIAEYIEVDTTAARRILNKMEKKGLVQRDLDWSLPSLIYWRVVE